MVDAVAFTIDVDAVAFTVVVDVANIPGTQAYSSPTNRNVNL